MKGIIKKIIFFVTLFLIVNHTSDVFVLAEEMVDKNYDDQYNSYDYVINKYDVNIIVNENNTFDVIETISVHFNEPNHGIFRVIPLKNNIVREDESNFTKRVQISNLSVDSKYTEKIEKDRLIVEIGVNDYNLVGDQTYVIKYTYNNGNDSVRGYDELYYSIIGDEWNTVIENVTFSITMPKEFDYNEVVFDLGKFDLDDNTNVIYSVNNNIINGYYVLVCI